jgi:hypothetical protein
MRRCQQQASAMIFGFKSSRNGAPLGRKMKRLHPGTSDRVPSHPHHKKIAQIMRVRAPQLRLDFRD